MDAAAAAGAPGAPAASPVPAGSAAVEADRGVSAEGGGDRWVVVVSDTPPNVWTSESALGAAAAAAATATGGRASVAYPEPATAQEELALARRGATQRAQLLRRAAAAVLDEIKREGGLGTVRLAAAGGAAATQVCAQLVVDSFSADAPLQAVFVAPDQAEQEELQRDEALLKRAFGVGDTSDAHLEANVRTGAQLMGEATDAAALLRRAHLLVALTWPPPNACDPDAAPLRGRCAEAWAAAGPRQTRLNVAFPVLVYEGS